MSVGYYGDRVIAQSAHALLSRKLKDSAFAITRLTGELPHRDVMALPCGEAALVLTMAMVGTVKRDLYLNGGSNPSSTPVTNGSFSFLDLREEAALRVNGALDCVQFYLPLNRLEAAAQDVGLNRLGDAQIDSGAVVADSILFNLASSLLPSFEDGAVVSQLFVDSISQAVASHVLATYCGAKLLDKPLRGGLAAWQQKRVLEMIEAKLTADISLDDLAAECRLSPRHLSRAFRQSMGMPPHQWLLNRRIEKAKVLLRDGRIPLLGVALGCGFADQSHFTRAFTSATGTPPGLWRRQTQVDNRLPEASIFQQL